MTLRGYDEWKEPSERMEAVEIRCDAELVFCGCTGEPTTLYERRRYVVTTLGHPPPSPVGPGYELVSFYLCELCHKDEDLDVDKCGEVWETASNYNEALGHELGDEKCPRCGNDDVEKMEVSRT